MKKLNLTLLLSLSILLNLYSQAPFGTPPGSTQPQTQDEYYSGGTGGTQGPITYIYSRCSNTPSAAYQGPTNVICTTATTSGNPIPLLGGLTGNDIQRIEESTDVVEATVWEGDIAAFSFIHKDASGSVQANFVVELMGNYTSNGPQVITDPDIIIAPFYNIEKQGPNYFPEISIIIVYESASSVSAQKDIYFEQWLYDPDNGIMEAAFLPTSTVGRLSDPNDGGSHNPNIDINDFGHFVITYESNGKIYVVPYKINERNLSYNLTVSRRTQVDLDYDAYDPDICIGEHVTSPEPVHVVYNRDNGGNPVMEVCTLTYDPTPPLITSPLRTTIMGISTDDPRIDAPRKNYSSAGEFAAITVGDANVVTLYTNINSPGIVSQTITPASECASERPAVTFGQDNTICTAWTYYDYDCPNNYSLPEDKKVISVNYTFSSGGTITRTPSATNYYMGVCRNLYQIQEHVSLSYLEASNFNNNSVYYSHSFYDVNPGNGILYKHSKPFLQPQIRKKSTSLNSNNNLTIHPNPASNSFSINYTSKNQDFIQIKIFDFNGKLVFNELKESKSLNNIEVSHLRSGIYYVRIEEAESMITQKLVINK